METISNQQNQKEKTENSGSFNEELERIYLQGNLDRVRMMKKNTEDTLEILMTFKTLFDKKKWAIKELEYLEEEEKRLINILK